MINPVSNLFSPLPYRSAGFSLRIRTTLSLGTFSAEIARTPSGPSPGQNSPLPSRFSNGRAAQTRLKPILPISRQIANTFKSFL